LGHRLDETELERVYRQVTALADRIKTVSDEQLASIIREEVGRQGLGTGSRVNVVGQVQGAAWR
jgi:isopropylmalate/homocitrate/citramalate synthase